MGFSELQLNFEVSPNTAGFDKLVDFFTVKQKLRAETWIGSVNRDERANELVDEPQGETCVSGKLSFGKPRFCPESDCSLGGQPPALFKAGHYLHYLSPWLVPDFLGSPQGRLHGHSNLDLSEAA